MPDLKTLLGDRWKGVLQTAAETDDPKLRRRAAALGKPLGELLYLDAVARMDRVLTAVLPDLLADAWDEGYLAAASGADRVYHRHGESDTPNPYRGQR